MSRPLLEVKGLTVTYGGVHANAGIDLTISSGQFVGLIGSNGAGKTTFVDALTGFTALTAGSVTFDGVDVTHTSPDARARLGLVRTFQSVELFDDLSVWDNLLVACERTRWWAFPWEMLQRRVPDAVASRAQWALETAGLQDVRDRLPRELSHGQRKVVGLARALAAKPKLVLLDEPAAGLDDHESAALSSLLRGLLASDITVFLIDHDMSLVLSVCDEIHVLDFGRMLAHGTPAEIRTNPAVIAAYLGAEAVEQDVPDELVLPAKADA
jgi:branched-chain amino acid transport system ATP-binding protein